MGLKWSKLVLMLTRSSGKTPYRRSVVPDGDVILAPLESSMHLLSGGYHFGEVLDDGITLGFRDAHDLGHESRVEEQAVPAGDGVCANERMLGGDRVTTNRPAKSSRVVGLHVCRVQCCQALEIGLHMWRKNIVCRIL